MLLKDFVDRKHCNFIENAEDWQAAMRKACEPLIADGTVDGSYPETIIQNVKENGPYIIIVPGVALPHSMMSAKGVNKTAVSFMKCEQPVYFCDEADKYATIFLTVAAVNTDAHLKNMKQIFKMLTDDELLDDLMQVHNADDLLALDDKYSRQLQQAAVSEE